MLFRKMNGSLIIVGVTYDISIKLILCEQDRVVEVGTSGFVQRFFCDHSMPLGLWTDSVYYFMQ